MLALQMVEADTGNLGESLSEATSPDASGPNRKYHYEAEGPFANNAAQVAAAARDKYRKDWPDKNLEGLFWAVKKVPN